MKKGNPIFNVKNLFFILAIIPVVALVLITINLIIGSIPAIKTLGPRLFSGTFILSTEPATSTTRDLNYGIVPALWGTFLVVLLSMLIATPASMAIAIFCNDFSKGFVSSAIRSVLGVLSGIPPIIYAFMGSIFFLTFFWAKFAGKGLPLEMLPPPNQLPSDASCTLLGGLMLALLIIPFMSPLLDDAMQNVPSSLKEASFSLGANRWHTLTSVTFPYALPGIAHALILGMLTALGETIIVAYTIGFVAAKLPVPLFDVLKRVAPLTSTIAVLSTGGFSGMQLIGPIGHSVANFIGLLLLVIAFAILGLSDYLQRRLKRKNI